MAGEHLPQKTATLAKVAWLNVTSRPLTKRISRRAANIGELWLTFGMLEALLKGVNDWHWFLEVSIVAGVLLFPHLILGVGDDGKD